MIVAGRRACLAFGRPLQQPPASTHCRFGKAQAAETRLFSLANGLRPSHCCIDLATCLVADQLDLPAAISFCTVVRPIQTAVMLRSEQRT